MKRKMALGDQFLPELSDSQKGLVRDYYRLVTTSDIPRADTISRISYIWIQAEDDPVLLDWLEIIDFILSENDSDKSEYSNNNRRAYLNEHLSDEVELHSNSAPEFTPSWGSMIFTCELGGESVTLLITCPNGNSNSFESVTGESIPCQLSSFQGHSCAQCGLKLCAHKIVEIRRPVAI